MLGLISRSREVEVLGVRSKGFTFSFKGFQGEGLGPGGCRMLAMDDNHGSGGVYCGFGDFC